jgi:hypothetical protein
LAVLRLEVDEFHMFIVCRIRGICERAGGYFVAVNTRMIA